MKFSLGLSVTNYLNTALSAVISVWILTTGFWNDQGVWSDASFWMD